MRRVVILGSGFAGLEAAILLSREKGIKLTVVDKSKHFTFTPSLHFLISNKRKISDITMDFAEFYKSRGVDFINGGVTYIDPEQNLVKTKNKSIKYDFLIIASGSETNFFDEEIKKRAYSLKTVKDSIKIKEGIKKIKNCKIVVCGGGLTGIETVHELKDYDKNIQITLVERGGALMREFGNRMGNAVEGYTAKRGIGVIKGIGVKEIKNKGVILEDGRIINADLVIWTAGIRIPELITTSKIPTDKKGIMVDEFLQSVKYNDIYAIGDVATVAAVDNKKTAQTAVMMGKVVAKNIIRKIENKQQKRFRARQALYLISLGHNGLVVYKDFFMINRIFLWLKIFVEKMYMKMHFNTF